MAEANSHHTVPEALRIIEKAINVKTDTSQA